jgi:exopolysaccharide biosynthesis predicted pyruvyltransferase EpsI
MRMNDAGRATDTIQVLGRKLHETVDGLADLSSGYVLLDFPNYPNVGDSLIWLGEVEFFRRTTGCIPDYVSTRDGFNADDLRRFCPEGPIYLSGGGNFGDIWPKFQAFRRAVLEAFPDRRVVQLPQSVHFGDERNVADTARMIERHGNFHLLVRDLESYEFSRAHFQCEVQLCPDMAFALGPQASQPPSRDAVFLLRTDIETSGGRGSIPADASDVLVADWLDDGRDTRLMNRLLLPLARRSTGALNSQRPVFEAFERIAASRKARGRKLLGAGRVVVTDRLHAHILSLLLGRPQLLIDNANGKVGRFVRQWTGRDPLVRMVPSLEAACELLKQGAQAGEPMEAVA